MKDGKFEVGDTVRFVDNELNRAECALHINKTLIVEYVHVDGLLKLRENENTIHFYHSSRFELAPQYQVGDWILADNDMQLIVRSIEPDDYDGFIAKTISGYCYGFSPDGKCANPAIHEFNGMPIITITRKLSPAEVVIDFGNGIKGVIRQASEVKHDFNVFADSEFADCDDYDPADDRFIASISYDALTDPMKSIVQDLLAKQEKA